MSDPLTLPSNTYAIMVHKLYQERVKHYLLTRPRLESNEPFSLEESLNDRCKILDSPALTGVSRARRGYFLVLLKETVRSIEGISPMARQNISWVGRISHQQEIPSDTAFAIGGSSIWKTLKGEGFDIQKDRLRVDVHPRDQVEEICLQLQAACAQEQSKEVPLDPFEGPISMTMSRSKCSHRLVVIIVDRTFYWGIENRQDHQGLIELKLNHQAAEQITVCPCNHETGAEINENVNDKIPLSRAYYKLHEIWEEYLKPNMDRLQLEQGVGLDLGASPGGWTQVLVHLLGLERVVAVDRAKLADRVVKLPSVTHVLAHMDEAELKEHGPYSIVVCDASLFWADCVEQIKGTIVKRANWCLPSVWVITMKLPFKTLGSIQRHMDLMKEDIPRHLEDMAHTMYPNKKIRSKSRIVHLMANSDSERTLIAIFEKVEIA